MTCDRLHVCAPSGAKRSKERRLSPKEEPGAGQLSLSHHESPPASHWILSRGWMGFWLFAEAPGMTGGEAVFRSGVAIHSKAPCMPCLPAAWAVSPRRAWLSAASSALPGDTAAS